MGCVGKENDGERREGNGSGGNWARVGKSGAGWGGSGPVPSKEPLGGLASPRHGRGHALGPEPDPKPLMRRLDVCVCGRVYRKGGSTFRRKQSLRNAL